MEGSIIASPFTENWVAWVMLLMLLLLGVVHFLEPGRYQRAFASIPTTRERDSIFVGSGADTRTRVLLTVYDVFILGITLQWACRTGDYSIRSFLLLSAMAAAMMLIRFLLQSTVVFTFFRRGELETFTRHYHYLSDCLMLLLYPIALLVLFCPFTLSLPVLRCLLLGLLAAACGVLVYKLIACFPFSLRTLLFLPLYLLTVEIIPVAALAVAAHSLL